MEIKGTFIKQLEQKTGLSKAGKEWIKREFVIQTPGQYGKEVCIQAFNDKGDVIDGLAEGEGLTISIDLESRAFNDKYYTSVNAFKISVDSPRSSTDTHRQAAPIATVPVFQYQDDGSSDLPF